MPNEFIPVSEWGEEIWRKRSSLDRVVRSFATCVSAIGVGLLRDLSQRSSNELKEDYLRQAEREIEAEELTLP